MAVVVFASHPEDVEHGLSQDDELVAVDYYLFDGFVDDEVVAGADCYVFVLEVLDHGGDHFAFAGQEEGTGLGRVAEVVVEGQGQRPEEKDFEGEGQTDHVQAGVVVEDGEHWSCWAGVSSQML